MPDPDINELRDAVFRWALRQAEELGQTMFVGLDGGVWPMPTKRVMGIVELAEEPHGYEEAYRRRTFERRKVAFREPEEVFSVMVEQTT